jgi:hypothetical protein
MTATPAPDLSDAEREVVDRFEAAEPGRGARSRRELEAAMHDGTATRPGRRRQLYRDRAAAIAALAPQDARCRVDMSTPSASCRAPRGPGRPP